jgi:hypothetical protein
MEAEVEKLADEAQEKALGKAKPSLDFATSNVLVPVAGRSS